MEPSAPLHNSSTNLPKPTQLTEDEIKFRIYQGIMRTRASMKYLVPDDDEDSSRTNYTFNSPKRVKRNKITINEMQNLNYCVENMVNPIFGYPLMNFNNISWR